MGKLGVLSHIFNLSTQEVEVGESHSVGNQPGLWNEFSVVKGTYLESAPHQT